MFKKIIEKIRVFRETPEEYGRRIGVKIGKGCYISTKHFSTEPYLIEIGDWVRIAPDVAFFTHGGIWTLRKLYNDPTLDHFGKIKIGDYSFVGERSMIMPGVTIGERCIVGGGSVVTKSVPDGCMVAGNPARFIGYTEAFYSRLKDKGFDTKTKGRTEEEVKKILCSLPDKAFENKPYIKIDK